MRSASWKIVEGAQPSTAETRDVPPAPRATSGRGGARAPGEEHRQAGPQGHIGERRHPGTGRGHRQAGPQGPGPELLEVKAPPPNTSTWTWGTWDEGRRAGNVTSQGSQRGSLGGRMGAGRMRAGDTAAGGGPPSSASRGPAGARGPGHTRGAARGAARGAVTLTAHSGRPPPLLRAKAGQAPWADVAGSPPCGPWAEAEPQGRGQAEGGGVGGRRRVEGQRSA